jgi:hypothetical protein
LTGFIIGLFKVSQHFSLQESLNLEMMISDPRPCATNIKPLPADKMLRIALKQKLKQCVLVFLITFLMAEALARIFVAIDQPLLSHSADIDRKLQLAQQLKPAPLKKKILVIGDSYAGMAFYPELIMEDLRRQGYEAEIWNLASPGYLEEYGLYFLQTVVKNGVKPDLVIYNISPHRFQERHLTPKKMRKSPKYTSYLYRCEVSHSGNFADQLVCLGEKASLLLRYKNVIGEALRDLPGNVVTSAYRPQFKKLSYTPTEISPNGWQVGYLINRFKPDSEEINQKRWEWTEKNIQPFMEYTREKNIPVTMIWLPEHPKRYSNYKSKNVIQDSDKTYPYSMEEFDQRFEHTATLWHSEYLNMHELLKSDQYYYDWTHLNAVGAVEFGHVMADALAHHYFESGAQK